jgi:tetratricopeptide (TPR) repeat protein
MMVSICTAQDSPSRWPEELPGIEHDLGGLRFRNDELAGKNSLVPRAISDPSTSEPPGTISVARLRQEVPKEARRAFDRAAKLSSKRDYAGAALELEKAVALAPNFSEAHANLGAQHLRLLDLDRAIPELQRAAELDPTISAVHSNLALAFLRKDDSRLAEMHARRALALFGSDDKARFLLGLALARSPETLAEGIEQLQKAADTLPVAREVLARIGLNHAWSGRGDLNARTAAPKSGHPRKLP